MSTEPPYICDDDSDTVCWICPALRLPAGQFDIYEKPTSEAPFDPATGYRYTAAGVAVCVHPYKIGLPAGRYASAGIPFPGPAHRPVETAKRATGTFRPLPSRPIHAAPTVFPGPASVPEPQLSDAAIMAGARPRVPDELLSWMRGLVADAVPDDLAVTLDQAEEAARQKFTQEEVIEALRRVLGG